MSNDMESTTKKISLDAIDDPRIAIRTELDDESLNELMADMKVNGLIEPVVVRPVGNRYELIAGSRRTRAARLLGWGLIEAKIIECTDEEAFSMRLAENLQRKDVDPVDESAYVGEIMLRTHKSLEQVGEMLHQSPEWVKSRYAVFGMDDELKVYLAEGRISLGAALELSSIKNVRTRTYYVHWAAQNGVAVANAKRWRMAANSAEERRANSPPKSPEEMRDIPIPKVFLQCAECGGDVPQELADYVPVHKKCPAADEAATKEEAAK